MKHLPPLFILILGISLSTFGYTEEIGDYELGKWYPAPNDATVQVRVTKVAPESAPRVEMTTTMAAPPHAIMKTLTDYERYGEMGMPRIIKGTVLQTYENASVTLRVGKERQLTLNLSNTTIMIGQFELDIPFSWGADYCTALFVTVHDPVTHAYRIYWIQYDEEALACMTGAWCEYPFDMDNVSNTTNDLYAMWELLPAEGQATHVKAEFYVDPGFWGRRFMGLLIGALVEDLSGMVSSIRANIRHK